MALGKPVVATALGGVTELVRDAETGFLIPPDDVDRLADALARLVDAPERREAVGRAAFDEASRRFDVGPFVDAFTGHLERAATAAQKRR